jgi:hypothetical protein
VDQAAAARLEERINREITDRFPAGSVRRVTLVPEVTMRRLRRELSLRLPLARLLEFTEVVDVVVSLLRSAYVFPDRTGPRRPAPCSGRAWPRVSTTAWTRRRWPGS